MKALEKYRFFSDLEVIIDVAAQVKFKMFDTLAEQHWRAKYNHVKRKRSQLFGVNGVSDTFKHNSKVSVIRYNRYLYLYLT